MFPSTKLFSCVLPFELKRLQDLALLRPCAPMARKVDFRQASLATPESRARAVSGATFTTYYSSLVC